ncbi:MAG: glycosyltransferase family 4 protein [Holosporaceae bacterium]|jgi:glycosyltransferase involved in cell wall biosynthesis|nr:glycosyltransferase family 4 protein [Holosporaceae bacterium]
MKKILYTTPELMYPAAGGPYLRVENSIKALGTICKLHVVSRMSRDQIGGEKAERFYKSITPFFSYSPSASTEKNNLKYLIRRIIWGKNTASVMADADYIINYARRNNIKIIWFGYGNISYHLMKKIKSKAPKLKIVCDTDSVWSRFILRELALTKNKQKKRKIENKGQKKETEEADWVNFCDVTTAVSEVDADYYRKLAQNPARIKIFSNVLDLATYQSKPPPPDNFKTPCIYLAGSFWSGSPMEVAARWVIDDILPQVRESIPDIHLYIVGRNSDVVLNDINDPNITITGQLRSVLPYLHHANVSLVPLKFESGTRFKILESAACEVPLVSTTLGAEGIPVTDGDNILIADDAAAFAQAIIKLVKKTNYGKNIAHNLKIYVQQNYSLDKHVQEASEIVEYLSN